MVNQIIGSFIDRAGQNKGIYIKRIGSKRIHDLRYLDLGRESILCPIIGIGYIDPVAFIFQFDAPISPRS
jgi:hypothetical protein